MNRTHDPSGVDWELVGRYFAGEMSPVEREALERWIAADPGRHEEMVLLRRLWDDAATIPSPEVVDRLWRSLAIRMSPPAGAAPHGSPVRREETSLARRVPVIPLASPASRLRPLAIGAAAAVLVVGAVLTDRMYAARAAIPDVAPIKEFRTTAGQRATIQLGDGSRVDLGVGSVLRVDPFTDSSRTVALEGEAIFDVEHDSRRPFRVLSAGTVTEDLGTRFGVRAYREDSGVRVFVVSGLVTVRPSATAAAADTLRRGQLARVDANGAITVEMHADTARYLAWTAGRLVLRSEPLRSAVTEIGRWHGVAITIRDPRVARLRITVDMRLGPLEETLNAITVPLGLRYVMSDSGVVILR